MRDEPDRGADQVPASNVVHLDLRKNRNVIGYMRKLLERCESGEISEFTITAVRPDGSYFTGWAGMNDSLRAKGMLMTAIQDIHDASEPT